jgi:uncharacterized protein
MAEGEKIVAGVIAVAGGELVGRVRLQKIIYLLDRLGLESGFEYDYHHYGPYSEELAVAVDDAKAEGFVKEEVRRRERDGMPYSIFTANAEVELDSPSLGSLDLDVVIGALGRMSRRSATVLELAATIDWLVSFEGVSDWRTELHRRKGAKASRGRVEDAIGLLQELGLFGD